ncbi:hypothetical protein BaRGS_00003371 [Batillaria attramentaria]|uniref:Uncharacterized protein n=1 Tax=Batillaria attramentaria TaxID=370345 RepID=A0ABD0M1M5_9CAEN
MPFGKSARPCIVPRHSREKQKLSDEMASDCSLYSRQIPADKRRFKKCARFCLGHVNDRPSFSPPPTRWSREYDLPARQPTSGSAPCGSASTPYTQIAIRHDRFSQGTNLGYLYWEDIREIKMIQSARKRPPRETVFPFVSLSRCVVAAPVYYGKDPVDLDLGYEVFLPIGFKTRGRCGIRTGSERT